MKAVRCIFLALAAILAFANADGKSCGPPCNLLIVRTCGFNGDCYREFGNPCAMDQENCDTKKAYKAVDLKLCEQAQEKKNDLKYCK